MSSSEFNGAGEWVGWIPSARRRRRLGEPTGVAVGATGRVRRRRALGRVDLYGPGGRGPGRQHRKGDQTDPHERVLAGRVNGVGEIRPLLLPVGHDARARLEHHPGRLLRRSQNRSARRSANCMPGRPTSSGSSPKTKTGAATGSLAKFTTPAGRRKALDRAGQEPAARKRDADGLAGAERVRRALLLPVGHDHRLRPHQPRNRRVPTPAAKKAAVTAEAEPLGSDAEHGLPLPAGRRKPVRDHVRRSTRSSRPPGRLGSRTSRSPRSGTKRRRSTPKSTRASSTPPTTSNTAKRPSYGTETPLGGARHRRRRHPRRR